MWQRRREGWGASRLLFVGGLVFLALGAALFARFSSLRIPGVFVMSLGLVGLFSWLALKSFKTGSYLLLTQIVAVPVLVVLVFGFSAMYASYTYTTIPTVSSPCRAPTLAYVDFLFPTILGIVVLLFMGSVVYYRNLRPQQTLNLLKIEFFLGSVALTLLWSYWGHLYLQREWVPWMPSIVEESWFVPAAGQALLMATFPYLFLSVSVAMLVWQYQVRGRQIEMIDVLLKGVGFYCLFLGLIPSLWGHVVASQSTGQLLVGTFLFFSNPEAFFWAIGRHVLGLSGGRLITFTVTATPAVLGSLGVLLLFGRELGSMVFGGRRRR